MKSRNFILIVCIIVFLFVSISFSSFISAKVTSGDEYSSDVIKSSGGREITSSDYDTKTVTGTITGKASSLDYGTSLGFFSGIVTNEAPYDPDTKLRSSEGTDYTDEYLECYSLIEDPDGDELDAYVRWYKNGNLFDERAYENGYSSGTDFEATLSSSETAVGDVWKCGLMIYDGREQSNWVNSSELTIQEMPEEEEPTEEEEPAPAPAPDENVTEEGLFEVEPGLIKFTLKRGSAVRKRFKVSNIGNTSLNLAVSKRNLEFLRILDPKSFSLEQNETQRVSADFYVEEDVTPDVYSGSIDVKGDNNQTETVSVIINVEEKKPLFDVITDIEEKEIMPGDNVEADVTLINMGDLNGFDVLFRYAVRDLDGNTIAFKEESLAIDRQLNLTRELEIPDNTEPGQYIFYANVRYDDVSASGSETFRVVETTLPRLAFYIISFILLLIILIIIYLLYRKYMEYREKRRIIKETMEEE